MASIASHTIYSKTAKGLAEIRNKTGKLSRELTAILQAVDGKARFSELQAESGMTRPEMHHALEALVLQGFIQEVATGLRQPAGAKPADDDTVDLDFSSPEAIAEFNKQAERELRKQAEKRTEAGTKHRPEMDQRKRAEAAVAKARAEAEARKRVEAEAKKRAEAEAKRRAEAEARQRAELEAKAREEVEAKARAETEAKALAEAERASMEEARPAEDEFQRRAREEAELREREEAQASGRSIEEIKALEAQKRRAREEAAAKARAEAEAKARVEAEAKARIEAEAKARLEAEAKARAEAELKARVEAEVKARVEAKAKALVEGEAKARAEADRRAREEAERRAREEAERRARDEAERRAREQAELRAREEAERRAREEAERRVREEAERQAREEAERQAREAAERRAREEAEAKARAEEERRAREEAVAKARLEEDYRVREEAEAKARAEAARRTREEAEAAARAGREPRTRDEAEASKHERQDSQAPAGAHVPHETASPAHALGLSAATDDAEQARPDATAAEAAESGQPLVAPSANDLVRKLKAKVQAEWRARGKSKGQTLAPAADGALGSTGPGAAEPPSSDADPPDISAALRELTAAPASRSEALVDSDRAAAEHVPNVLESAMLQASARNEPAQSDTESQSRRDSSKAPADQRGEPAPRDFRAMDSAAIPLTHEDKPLHQRLNADRAAHDVLARAATERNYVDATLGHTVADEDARRSTRALRRQRQTRVVAALGILLVAAPVLATAWLQFVPLDSYIPEAQQALSEQLNQPATISSLRYVLLPTPRVVLEGVKVGQGIHIDRLEAPALPQALSSVPRIFDTVSAHGLTIDVQTLGTLPDWKSATSSGGVRVKRLAVDGVKIGGADFGLPTLNGEVTFTADGAPRQASFTSEKLKLDVVPEASGLRIVLTGQDSRIPFGPQVKFSHFTVGGVAARKRFTSTEMSAGIGSGSLAGTLQASWDGQITVAGDFKVQRVRLQEFAALVAPDFAASGLLTASGRYTFQSQTADTLMAKPVVEATFSLSRGEITNIDLLRATQSSGSNSFSGGRTMFEEVKGSLQIAGGQYSYRLQLISGPLNASGNLAVAPSGQLSGRVNAILAAHGTEVARTALNVGGTVKEPQLAQ